MRSRPISNGEAVAEDVPTLPDHLVAALKGRCSRDQSQGQYEHGASGIGPDLYSYILDHQRAGDHTLALIGSMDSASSHAAAIRLLASIVASDQASRA